MLCDFEGMIVAVEEGVADYVAGNWRLTYAWLALGLDDYMKEGDTIIIDNFFAYGKGVPIKAGNITLPKK